MKTIDIFSFALTNFLRRKARSALTVLGVIIGTAAVVIMLSIGIGMNKGFEDQVSSWGDLKTIRVYPYTGQFNEETGEYEMPDETEPLDDITVQRFRDELEHVKAVSPTDWGWSYMVKDNKERNDAGSISLLDASAMADMGYEVVYGRLLDERDVGTTNFVMAYNVPFNFYNVRTEDPKYGEYAKADEEFPFDPLSDKVKYAFTWYYGYLRQAVDTTKPRIVPEEAQCVGVLVQNETNIKNYGYDYDCDIYMDINGYYAMQERLQKNQNKYYGTEDEVGISIGGSSYYVNGQQVNFADGRENKYNSVIVIVDDVDHVRDVSKTLIDMGFETSGAMDSLDRMQEQTKFLRSILGAIGAVAFFVAAISIANTMVMSIYERTREIGIMKVIGCKLKDIRGMFLVEAAIIGIVGGALGVAFSYGISALVNKLAAGGGMEAFGIYSSDSVLSIIPPWLDLAALVLATAVGVISGLYPAIRATRLSALEAIKNE